MGWLRKAWARVRAFFTSSRPEQDVPVAEKVQPPAPAIDHSETFVMPSPLGSPLKAVIDQLDRVFPAPVIRPGAVLDDLQYKAGQRAVVDWLRLQQQKGRV